MSNFAVSFKGPNGTSVLSNSPKGHASVDLGEVLGDLQNPRPAGFDGLRAIIDGLEFGRSTQGDAEIINQLRGVVECSTNVLDKFRALFVLAVVDDSVSVADLKDAARAVGRDAANQPNLADRERAQFIGDLNIEKIIRAIRS